MFPKSSEVGITGIFSWTQNLKSLNNFLGEGNGNPLQYSCLENPMNGEAWWAAVHGVARSRTLLSDFTFTFHFHALEKAMATHSSVLAWRIPGMGEPGGLQSMGLHRLRHNWSDLAAATCYMPSYVVPHSRIGTGTQIYDFSAFFTVSKLLRTV